MARWDVLIVGGGPAGLSVQLVIMAAAEGTLAGFSINEALHAEDQGALTPSAPALPPGSA